MILFEIYPHLLTITTQYQQVIHKPVIVNGQNKQPIVLQMAKNAKPNPAQKNASTSQPGEISDDSQLHLLKRQLFNQINPIWSDRKNLTQDLVYRVAVATNGNIIAYQPLDKTANRQVTKTPLPAFVSQTSTIPGSVHQTFASFRVVFRKSGVLEISPWWGFSKRPDVVGDKITESRILNRLQRQLTANLKQYWNGKTSSKQDLKYRVAVNKNGIITDYEPINQVAYDHFRDTPLPFMFQELHGSNVAITNEKQPLAHFRVVFKRNGLLEITPWKLYLFR
ncbi:hypothetical protein NIES4101_72870 [Calothrix sp. NIES-4101]|nr:hypothetical protein NIES4101_72870 [Calothrix sp. NIES-4101]